VAIAAAPPEPVLPLAIPAMAPPAEPAPQPELPTRPPERGAEARAFAEQYGIRKNDPCPCGSGLKFKKCCLGEEPSASV
jgi:uncharacterized protein YecA (UPF0149 family)